MSLFSLENESRFKITPQEKNFSASQSQNKALHLRHTISFLLS
jgi:hypothetical protein